MGGLLLGRSISTFSGIHLDTRGLHSVHQTAHFAQVVILYGDVCIDFQIFHPYAHARYLPPNTFHGHLAEEPWIYSIGVVLYFGGQYEQLP